MDMRRFLSGSCHREPLKNAKKRRDRDFELQLTYSGKPKSPYKGGNPAPLQPFASGGHHPESSSSYVLWPPSSRHNGSAEERAAYFSGLQKAAELEADRRIPGGQQATTLLDLMTIRAFHTKTLRRYSLGTALGFRTRGGTLTNIPAIIVFVGRKVHKQWLLDMQRLPSALVGPGGVWCDVDVVEFSYYGAPTITPKEQLYTELVDGLRGNDPYIGSGSQVASQETYGTLGGLVQSQTPDHQLGFLTNRHVAVDLDYPNQKMFHPLPPGLGPGVYLGAVERATSFITDDLWYGVFAGMNPETFVRADGAFVPFTDTFDVTKVTASLKGVGEVGEVMRADLQAPIENVIGQHVMKVGRSSGLTKGVIMAYAIEYNDERGICYFTDFLVVGENGQPFDLEGDSGSLILLTGEQYEKPRPFGIIWGGTATRGRLKLRSGHGPENWTSGVDLGRLLDLLQLDLITTQSSLLAAIEDHRRYQLRVERGGLPGGGFRDLGVLEEGNINIHHVSESGGRCLEEPEDLQEDPAGTGEEDPSTPKFANQEWRATGLVCTVPATSDDEECSLPLVGAAKGFPSTSKQEGKGSIEEGMNMGLGMSEREMKRRRLS